MNKHVMSANRDVVYWINDLDEICFINKRYDEFADRNFGRDAHSERVINRPLWDFICDRTTQALYRQALARVRRGRQLRFDFRCDAPAARRTMQMQMACVESGAVEFRVRLLDEVHRPAQMLLEYAVAHAQHQLRICCWCNKVAVGDSWLEVEAAVQHLQLFERRSMPALTHVMCSSCHGSILRILTT